MTSLSRLALAAGAFVLLGLAPALAQISASQRTDIERIIREYIVSHPEVLQEAMMELEKRAQAADAARQQSAVKEHSKEIFDSTRQVVLGNPKGDVTLVEFFDYNCPYCKHAMSDMLTLLKTDPKLRVVLKEYPVLGPQSEEAARVAVAVRMQDKTGKKYLEFHEQLFSGRGWADKAHALAVAKNVGLDVARIEKDMKSPEVDATLQESQILGRALGFNGTPSYVVGKDAVVGAVGLDALKEKINTNRCGKTTC
jgi:protein-disulfide isomerase